MSFKNMTTHSSTSYERFSTAAISELKARAATFFSELWPRLHSNLYSSSQTSTGDISGLSEVIMPVFISHYIYYFQKVHKGQSGHGERSHHFLS